MNRDRPGVLLILGYAGSVTSLGADSSGRDSTRPPMWTVCMIQSHRYIPRSGKAAHLSYVFPILKTLKGSEASRRGAAGRQRRPRALQPHRYHHSACASLRIHDESMTIHISLSASAFLTQPVSSISMGERAYRRRMEVRRSVVPDVGR